MIKISVFILMLMILASFCNTQKPNWKKAKFNQSILAVGVPYYKMLMSLGNCSNDIIFEEQKAWGKVKYNRILDIYYKSQYSDILVSKVEIEVVLDSTDCSVYSAKGLGHSEFSATMFIPTRVSMIFYHLKIWTCSKHTFVSDTESRQPESVEDSSQEETADKLPLPEKPIRPDSEPHHIIYDPDHKTDPLMYIHPNSFDIISHMQKQSKINATTQLPLNFAQFSLPAFDDKD